jgi:hypothetical protein
MPVPKMTLDDHVYAAIGRVVVHFSALEFTAGFYVLESTDI